MHINAWSFIWRGNLSSKLIFCRKNNKKSNSPGADLYAFLSSGWGVTKKSRLGNCHSQPVSGGQ